MAKIDLMHQIEIVVTIPRSIPLRLWIAKRLIGLAAWVLSAKINVDIQGTK